MDKIKNIVFDLGGVILTIDRDEAVRRFKLVGLEQAEELLDPYHQKGDFLAWEEGRLTTEEFYDAIRRLAGKYISNEDIAYGIHGFIADMPAYKLEMLEELRKSYNLYLLSNTNPIVMAWASSPLFSDTGKTLEQYFDKMYLSYQLGVTKPHPQIFHHLIKDSGIIPSETLFVDDGPANVEAGKALGMRVFQPENGEDFRHIFSEKGHF
ncbi:MAG: HAD family phosphatase [Dysgonamonadaceae bacterium]|jgi:putative hydrolase of the HAD superfamily|nr:HAD family phosphatase [Dysgonamonadaceae bacterium]